MDKEHKRKSCTLCENETPDFLFNKEGFDVVRCKPCGLTYLDTAPGEQEIEDFYSEEYFVSLGNTVGYTDYFACENYLKYNFERRHRIIERYCDGGALLDVGCGPGFYLEILSQRWSPHGIDVSPFACRAAREKGLNVIHGAFSASRFEPQFFNAVTMWNVFEHFSNPLDALHCANKVMKPDGVLAIYTNNVDSLSARLMGKYWHMYIIPDHLYYFSRNNVRSMLEHAGFEILKMHSETGFFAMDYLIEHFLKIFRIRVDRSRYPAALRALLNRVKIPINFFDTITVYARKKTESSDAQ